MKEILHFTADWCKPCEKMKPIIEEILKDYPNVSYGLYDVDTQHNIAHILSIRSVPTLVIMEGNHEVKRMVGAKTRDEIIEFFDVASQ